MASAGARAYNGGLGLMSSCALGTMDVESDTES